MCKKFWKNTHIGIWQNLELISHVTLRSLNIPSLKALTGKLSHDQSLCTYLMRHDAHLQSHPRSWPKWYIYPKKLKSDEKNQSFHPDTDGRTNNFIVGGIISVHTKFELAHMNTFSDNGRKPPFSVILCPLEGQNMANVAQKWTNSEHSPNKCTPQAWIGLNFFR